MHEGILIISRLNDAIADYAIDGVAEKREVGFGAQGFFDNHAFGVDNRAIRTDIGIGQYLAQPFDTVTQYLHGLQDFARGDEGFDEWTGKAECGAFEIDAGDATGIPLEGIGHTEQAYRFPSRSRINDHYLKISIAGVAIDVEQADDFIHARNEGQFFRHHRVQAAFA